MEIKKRWKKLGCWQILIMAIFLILAIIFLLYVIPSFIGIPTTQSCINYVEVAPAMIIDEIEGTTNKRICFSEHIYSVKYNSCFDIVTTDCGLYEYPDGSFIRFI